MNKKLIIGLATLLVVQLAITFYWISTREKKVVYADTIQLFNEYKFKLDVEKMTAGKLTQLKSELDSIAVIYKTNPSDEHASQLVYEKQQEFAATYEAINKDINAQVWERLNPVIQKFGKDRSLDLMVGANGMGTVLYASDTRDVTADLIQYVNQQYEKGN